MHWNKKSILQVYCSQVQKAIDDFETSTEAYFGVKFDPIMKRILIFATIFDCTPKEHRHKIVEYFNLYLEYPKQIKEYASKTANILENPFTSTNISSGKITGESTVSNIQSYTHKSIKTTFQGLSSKSSSSLNLKIETTMI